MRDQDLMIPGVPERFGSGIIGVCDICGTRQAVIILSRERYKLCVIDFLNKTWIKTDKKPGAPLPPYRSERVWFDTEAVAGGRAPAIVLSPTKVVKHPTVLVTPDVYGLTTSVLDGAIRFAREGFEVLLPDVGKAEAVGPADHLALRVGRLRGGVPVDSPRLRRWLAMYADALAYLRGREMVDPNKSAVFGISYGGSLAIGVAAEDQKLSALALAYPMPVRPRDFPRLITSPVLHVAGDRDRAAAETRDQLLRSLGAAQGSVEVYEIAGGRHDFLARDLRTYDLPLAELAWARIVHFVKGRLVPPPPKPPAPRTSSAPSAGPAKAGGGSSAPVPANAAGSVPPAPPSPAHGTPAG